MKLSIIVATVIITISGLLIGKTVYADPPFPPPVCDFGGTFAVCPTPTNTLVPTSTATPIDTATPTSTATPTATATPLPPEIDHTYVVQHSVLPNPGPAITINMVFCDTGDVITGGGFSYYPGGVPQVFASQPLTVGGQGWETISSNVNANAPDVFAVCLDNEPIH